MIIRVYLPTTCTQVGYYYLFNGGTEDKCPVASCTNARLGEYYTRGYAFKPDECPTKTCNDTPPPGRYFGTPGRCVLAKCGVAPRGTYYIRGCELGNCTNGNSSTYYVPGFNTRPDHCTLKNCGQPPPPGVLFSNVTGCDTVVCSNAAAGSYYVQVQQERSAYLWHMRCPTQRCAMSHVPGAPALRYVRGFADAADQCVTERCDINRLPVGHFFVPFSNCSTASCPPVRGKFYLAGAEGGESGCERVLAACVNAIPGEEYELPNLIVISPRGCPVRNCAAPPVGRFYARGGQCSATARCTVAEIGQHYVAAPGLPPCQVQMCSNAKLGQYYPASSCAVAQCVVVQGYRQATPGKCSSMRRCATPPAGFYYGSPKERACEISPCAAGDRSRRHYRFVAAFVLRKDRCVKQPCTGDPPARYAAPDTCAAGTTVGTTTAVASSKSTNTAIPLSESSTAVTNPVTAKSTTSLFTNAEPARNLWGIVGAVVASSAVVLVVVGSVTAIMVIRRSRSSHREDGDVEDAHGDDHDAEEQKVGVPVEEGAVGVSEAVQNRIASAEFLLGRDDVELGQRIARGGEGQIFAGQFGHQAVALKERFVLTEGEFARESAMMTKLRHPNVVRFFGIWQSDQRVFLVMELCAKGDLQDAALDNDNTAADRQKWILQVAWHGVDLAKSSCTAAVL